MEKKPRTFRGPWRERSEIQGEVDEEIFFHLEMRTRELIECGIREAAAREQAEREFGDVRRARRRLASMDLSLERERRRLEWLREFFQDCRFALRTLRLNPGFTLVTLLTLGLGVGVNSSIFSVVNGVLFRPLPFFEEERLVAVWPDKGLQKGEYEILRTNSTHYQGLSLYQSGVGFSMAVEGDSERLIGALVGGDLFRTLAVAPQLGRIILPADQDPGAAPVAVISDGLWQRRFGRRTDILTIQLELDGIAHSVVGVMPSGLAFPDWGTEIWTPLRLDPGDAGDYWGTWGGSALGRLREGRTAAGAEQELRALAEQMRLRNPLWTPLEGYGSTAAVVNLRDQIVGNVRPLLLLVLGAVGFVLLMACANVGNLLLAKGLAREREWALRGALGASRGRLVRQLLTESLVLGLGAGVLGFGLALLGQIGLLRLLPADLPRLEEITIDYRVFLFTLAAALATGVLAGLWPALRVGRSDLRIRLVEGGRSGSASHRRGLSRSLVAAEIGLAVMLVSGAALLAHSFINLWQTETGFRRTGVVRASISPPSSKYQSPEKRRAFYEELVERLKSVSGVQEVAVSNQVPFDSRVQRTALFIEGVTEDPNSNLPMFDFHQVSDGYFQALGIPLLRGRAFNDQDRAGSPAVALIDERAAQAFFPGVDPIGKILGRPWLRERIPIVGVVGSVRNQSLSGIERPALYVPFLQDPPIEARLVLRTGLSPADLLPSLRSIVAGLDPESPLSRVQTNQEAIEATLGKPGLAAGLLIGFALLALLLGGIGVYGIISFSVRRRNAEIGVRLALGADRRQVVGMILKEAATMTGLGIAAGVLGVLALAPLLEGLLYGIPGHDPFSLGQAVLLLTLVSLAAAYLPARTAVRISPLQALRRE